MRRLTAADCWSPNATTASDKRDPTKMATEYSKAQDAAAGGAEYRKLRLVDGTVVTASVAVHHPAKGYDLWGFLRFKTGGKTMKRYIGKVTADSYEASLRIGWQEVRQKRVVEQNQWSWVSKPPSGRKK